MTTDAIQQVTVIFTNQFPSGNHRLGVAAGTTKVAMVFTINLDKFLYCIS